MRSEDMKRACILLLVLIFSISLTTSLMAKGDQMKRLKKRVAVFDFEDKTEHRHRWWTGQPVGEGMADMLTTELVKSGQYIVIERQSIESIMKEQQLGMTGAVTSQSAAKVGQLLGVELAIVGAVTEFGWAKSGSGINLKQKGFGFGISSASATVGIDVRFINTSTGEILAADNVRKEKSKKGLKIDTQKLGFKNRNDFDQSLVGKATREAIEDIMGKVDSQMTALPWQAKVIKVTGNNCYINSGAESGVNIGDVFSVYQKGEELIDPDTGLSLGSEETKIGEIGVANNNIGNGKASKCVIKSGAGIIEAGALVRVK